MSLPEGWRETTLGEISTFEYGKMPKKEKLGNGIYPTFSGYKYQFLYPEKNCNKDDLIVVARGVGGTGDVKLVREEVYLTNISIKFNTDKSQVTNHFLFYNYRLRNLRYLDSGSAQSQITITDLINVSISIPSLSEQKAIANSLSSFDKKIELLKEQNETLEQMAQGVFREWFVDGADESWEVCRLGDYVKTNIATLKKNDNLEMIQYLDTASLTEGQISSYQLLNINDAPSRAKRKVEHLDILISTVRPDQKHYGIIRNPDDNIIVSTGYCVLNCHKINPYFVYLFLTSKQMTKYLHNIAEGSTSTYPSLKPIDIENLEFNLPPSEKLESFFDIADSIWEKIDCNHNQIQTLQKTRDTLLPKLMSGEVRVL